jgi:putative SOS response-associated peptidase YedK
MAHRQVYTRNIELMRWGLVPFWAKDIKMGYSLINARSESIQEKPTFRQPFHKQRCLIPSDGYYEWKKDGSGSKTPSIPYYFSCLDHKPFFFAGIWDRWHMEPENDLLSCSIITCAANEIVAPIHDRMPVMLNPEDSWNWLLMEDPNQLKAFLKPFPADQMTAYPVSRQVNSPSNDLPGLVDPIS